MNIKKTGLLILLFAMTLSLQAQKKFVVNGTLTDLKEPAKVLISYKLNGKRIVDSAAVTNGKFTLTGEFLEPVSTTLILKPLIQHPSVPGQQRARADGQIFFMQEGVNLISGKGSLETAVIKAGQDQEDYLLLTGLTKPIYKKMNDISANSTALDEQLKKVEQDFLDKHPNSFVSCLMIVEPWMIRRTAGAEKAFDSLTEGIRNSYNGKRVAAIIAAQKSSAIGVVLKDITQNDPNGNPVSSASFKGKYLLIDFWASWCIPCRKENPNLVKMYNEYKGQNFEILAISLDSKKEAWLAAIQKDALAWPQVSDLKGWKNEVALRYNVKVIPANFLLDPEGKVIGINLRGDELAKKLAVLFPKSSK